MNIIFTKKWRERRRIRRDEISRIKSEKILEESKKKEALIEIRKKQLKDEISEVVDAFSNVGFKFAKKYTCVNDGERATLFAVAPNGKFVFTISVNDKGGITEFKRL